MELGIDLHGLSGVSDATRIGDCLIVAYLEHLPVSVDLTPTDIIHAFDLTSTSLSDEARADVLRAIAGAVSTYVRATSTESDLRSRFRAGDLGSAFIRKDARAFLE